MHLFVTYTSAVSVDGCMHASYYVTLTIYCSQTIVPYSSSYTRLVLTHGIPPNFCGGAHLIEPPYAIGSVPSLSGHALAYRWRSPARVCCHGASSRQGSSRNGCLPLHHHGPIDMRLSSPTPTIYSILYRLKISKATEVHWKLCCIV